MNKTYSYIVNKKDGIDLYENCEALSSHFFGSVKRKQTNERVEHGCVIECDEIRKDNNDVLCHLKDGRGWCLKKDLILVEKINKTFKLLKLKSFNCYRYEDGMAVYTSFDCMHVCAQAVAVEGIDKIHCDLEYRYGGVIRLSNGSGWVRKKYWTEYIPEEEEVEEEVEQTVEEEEIKIKPFLPPPPSPPSPPSPPKKKQSTPPPPTQRKRKHIPKKVRDDVWNRYIGDNIAQHRCLCCKQTVIKMTEFHVGHVKSVRDGGDDSVSNLRPICAACNLSMGTQNMIEFCIQYGYIVG
jgi:hypothetical protein